MTYTNNCIQIDGNHYDNVMNKQYFTYDTDIICMYVYMPAVWVYRNILQLPMFKAIYIMSS